MRLALAEAESAVGRGDYGFGAVLVSGDNTVVATAGSTEVSTGDPTAHDGLRVVSAACVRLRRVSLAECTFYGTAEPCLMCAAALLQARVGRVVLGATGAELAAILGTRSLRLDDLCIDYGYQPHIQRGVLTLEAIAVLRRSLPV